MYDLNALFNIHRFEIEDIAASASIDLSGVSSLPDSGKISNIKALDSKYKGRVTAYVNKKSASDGKAYHLIAFVNGSANVENTSWSTLRKSTEKPTGVARPKLLRTLRTNIPPKTPRASYWQDKISLGNGLLITREGMVSRVLDQISQDPSKLKELILRLSSLTCGLLTNEELAKRVALRSSWTSSKILQYLTSKKPLTTTSNSTKKVRKFKYYKEMYEKASSNITSCPITYFDDKKISGALEDPALKLLKDKMGPFVAFPLKNGKGEYVGLQRIYQKRHKDHQHKFATNALYEGHFNGAHYIIGSISNDSTIHIVEGFATGYSIYMATGQPVVVALSAQALVHVTKEIKGAYPRNKIIIAADNDAQAANSKNNNTGILMALEAARGYSRIKIAVPFGNKKADWNDIHMSDGLDAVKDGLSNIIPVPRTNLDYNLALLPVIRPSKIKGVIKQITRLSGAPFLINEEDLIDMIHQAIQKDGRSYNRKKISSYVSGYIGFMRKTASSFASIRPKLVDDHMEVETVLNAHGHPTIPAEMVDLVSGLKNTICIVRAPMGTSKTEILMRKVLARVDKGVYAAPRRSLVEDAADRLGLDHYEGVDGLEASFSWKLALCINSIGSEKFKQTMADLDVFCLDEAIQALPQIPSLGTASAKKENYDALVRALEGSKLTLICDATANEFLVEELRKLAPNKTICLIDVKVPNPKSWDVQFTPDSNTARHTALQAIRQGQNLLVATDSRTEAQSLEQLFLEQNPNLNILNIHREPSAARKEAIRRFTKEPNKVCTEYDVIIYSPAITSGLSIKEKHFNCHVGIFFGVVNPMDILQMMGRDRTSTKWCLCIQDRGLHLKKDYREQENGLLKLAGQVSTFDQFKIAKEIYDFKSRDNLLAKTLHILTLQGHKVSTMFNIPEKNRGILGNMIKHIRENLKTRRYELIKSQEIVTDEIYEDLCMDVMLSAEGKAQIDAYRISNFLCSTVNESSIQFYENGGLNQIRLHEALSSLVSENGHAVKRFDQEEADKEASLRFYAEKKAECLRRSLELLGVSIKEFTGSFNHHDCQKVINHWMSDDNINMFNSLGLGSLSTKKPPKCATSWVRNFLSKLGLKLGKLKSNGRMIRFIDPESWKEIEGYLNARKESGQNYFAIQQRAAA